MFCPVKPRLTRVLEEGKTLMKNGRRDDWWTEANRQAVYETENRTVSLRSRQDQRTLRVSVKDRRIKMKVLIRLGLSCVVLRKHR